jgi:hypothetical protein
MAGTSPPMTVWRLRRNKPRHDERRCNAALSQEGNDGARPHAGFSDASAVSSSERTRAVSPDFTSAGSR